MLVHRYRQQQKFHEAILSSLEAGSPVTKDLFKETVDAYRRAMFPYIHKTLEDEAARTRRILDQAYAQGPVVIKNGQIVSG